ncbi:pancreatic triacylglycerol lipase-like [Lingula anatina]|uniref:Pancreatic triacylglycerol lipase-like n=1 Tax=Lingula anatina TaxID=7574 RepID=A0A1S3I9Y5_LINAN|nr:pancreatic triacylglycerol lipase-like [Lingula anatina]|eukprot:XP_013395075.1 pancreatic triacylglycerol lipase-like [Lingula anatina]
MLHLTLSALCLFFLCAYGQSDLTVQIGKGDSQDCPRAAWTTATFKIFTRTNTRGSCITRKSRTLQSAKFDGSKKTYFFAHGWLQSGTDDFNGPLVQALLRKEDANVIVVDWSSASQNINLLYSSTSAHFVGGEVAGVIKSMNGLGLSPKNTNLIGFSLGAKIMQVAGNSLAGDGKKVANFVALDPVAASYKGAADLVQVVHTSAISHLSSGDIDIFVNKGFVSVNPVRSHNVAIDIYTKSIEGGCGFSACAENDSKSCNRLGYGVSATGAKGKLYMTVTSAEKFC